MIKKTYNKRIKILNVYLLMFNNRTLLSAYSKKDV